MDTFPGEMSAQCTECEMGEDADDFSELIDFYEKHQEHTGHVVDWVTEGELGATVTKETEYVVHCNTCSLDRGFSNEKEAEEFREEHGEYTDHFADGIRRDRSWYAVCNWCGQSETFSNEKSAKEWHETHQSKSESHPDNQVVSTSRDRDQITTIKSIIDRMAEEHEAGAPIPLVHVMMENHGWLKSNINEEIQNLRRKGEVYEPKKGYLRTT